MISGSTYLQSVATGIFFVLYCDVVLLMVALLDLCGF